MRYPLLCRLATIGVLLAALSGCQRESLPAARADDAAAASDGDVGDDVVVSDAAAEATPDRSGDVSASAAPIPGLYFQILDDFENAAQSAGWVCPIGLCSWFAGPVGTRGGAAVVGVEAPAARGASKRAGRLVSEAGSGGSEVKLDVHAPGFPAVLYPNLERYAGIAFWARSDLPGQTLLTAIEDQKVIASDYLTAARSAEPWFTRSIELTSVWRRHVLLFDDFRQVEASGSVRASSRLDTSAVWSFHFLAGLDGKRSDVWIDDLALLCKGACPTPPHEPGSATTADGLSDAQFRWARSTSADAELTCAEIAELSMLPFDGWVAGPGEKVYLRARIPAAPKAEVPLWAWLVEKLPDGQLIPVTVIDPESTMVAVPLTEPGEYRVRVHTHFPAQQVCGAEVKGTAVVRVR